MKIEERINRINNQSIKICSRCIYDETVPNIFFNDSGVCNYCLKSDDLINEYGTGNDKGINTLNGIIDRIKKDGRNKKYDCVIGVSGGTDSSYLVHMAINHYGLRPLAVHYDNTWNTAIATENIRKVLGKLNVDLYTYVINNKESEDLVKSFLLAGVPEIDAATDIGAAELVFRICDKYRIKYVIEGHSFITEGISPMGNNYFDGKYIEDIHKKFGSMKLKTFTNMSFFSFIKWSLFKRIKKIRPLWYIDYSKEEARKLLEKEYDWKYYGGHHLENRITEFLHTYYNPKKFGIDNRNWSLAAASRNKLMKRDSAIEEYCKPIVVEESILDYVKKRLNLSEQELENIINAPKHYFWEFKTYKKRFEILRPLFYYLAKANLVPMSFYLKYCFPIKHNDNNS